MSIKKKLKGVESTAGNSIEKLRLRIQYAENNKMASKMVKLYKCVLA